MANKKPKKLVGFEFKPFSAKQLKVLNWWSDSSPVKNRRMMIADGSIRAGKAQPMDSILFTPNGMKKMGEIKINDYVFGKDGKPTRVLAVFPQGKKDVYKVTFQDGSCTECCKEHLWSVWKYSTFYHGDRNFTVVDTNELMNMDFKTNRPKYLFPFNGCVKFSNKNVKIDHYLLGLLLGDGGLTSKNIIITNGEQDIINYCCDLTTDCTVTRCKYSNSSRIRFISDYNSNLVDNLKFYNLYGKLSHDKFIPDDYKYNSEVVRLNILAGLLNTDGCTKKGIPTIRYGTVSEHLLNDVVEVARSLGMYVIKHDKKEFNNANWHTYYSCSIRPTIELINLLSDKHRNKLCIEQKSRKYKTLKSIDYIGKKECQCILVDNDEHLYLTDDFIVTHNTVAITLSFVLYVMKNFNYQNAAIAGERLARIL